VPVAPPRPCPGSPTCPHYVGACPDHAPRQAWQSSQLRPRTRGPKLQRRRDVLFTYEPQCRACLAQGRYVVAEIADHIIPLAEGGPDTMENLQPLCRACSDQKTQGESRRGRHRAGWGVSKC
jgi:5-methylcytosine-specific restriction protein A